jgi:hypothetical protein
MCDINWRINSTKLTVVGIRIARIDTSLLLWLEGTHVTVFFNIVDQIKVDVVLRIFDSCRVLDI